MFLRNYGYALIRGVRQKEMIFWTILFPIILGTLFKAVIGGIYEQDYLFRQIPVACVAGEEPQQEFETLLKELEEEEELIRVQYLERDEAEELLEQGEIKGIFQNDKEITLIVTEEGTGTSILNSIQQQYQQVVRAFSNIAAEHPEKIEAAVKSVGEQWNYLKESSITSNEMNPIKDFFYALLAMNCLYASFTGVICAVEYKANLSSLGARRVVASTNRFALLLAEICAKVTVQFGCTVVSICYLQYIMKVSMGNDVLRIALILLAGNAFGVMFGFFIGSIGKMKEAVKEGLCVCITMLCCFLAGLMVENMYQTVEESAPIINRINPAALITKAFYSLNIYETYTRYNQCIIMLLAMTGVLCIGSYLLVRRERYASI